MCNLTKTIHTPCPHPGLPSLKSSYIRAMFADSAIACKNSIIHGTTHIPTLCPRCTTRSEAGLTITLTMVVDPTIVKPTQKKEEAEIGEDEEVKLSAKQQSRRERNNTRRKVQVSGSSKLSILALMSPKIRAKFGRKLESIPESDEGDAGDVEEQGLLTLTAGSVSTDSSISSTLDGRIAALTLKPGKAVYLDGVSEDADGDKSDFRMSTASVHSASSPVTFGFAAIVPYQLIKAKVVNVQTKGARTCLYGDWLMA